jgi:hypothetical protein
LKKTLIIIILLIGELGFAQKKMPFYEQIAFDFYRSEIIDSFPVKKRIKIYKYAYDFQPNTHWFYTPSCLTNIVGKGSKQFIPIKEYVDNQWRIESDKFELDFSELDKKQFKIKKSGKGSFPKLFISSPHIVKGNNKRIFVNIFVKHSERKEVIYHLEFNQSGIIKNWCQSVLETVIIH